MNLSQTLSHTKLQLLVGLRDPAYFFSTIILPAGVFWIFGVPEAKSDYIGTFLCCSFSAFSFFGVFFFQYSINTSQEKNSYWLQYVKTLPVRNSTILMARFITSTLLGILSCFLIYGITRAMTPSLMSFSTFLIMCSLLIAASFPFLLMGLFFGRLFSAKAMVPVANFLHLILSFAGGLWKPPEILPHGVKEISPLLPTYHYGMLVWPLATKSDIPSSSVLYIFGFSVAMIVIILIQSKLSKKT